jgi:hypothetical protein
MKQRDLDNFITNLIERTNVAIVLDNPQKSLVSWHDAGLSAAAPFADWF